MRVLTAWFGADNLTIIIFLSLRSQLNYFCFNVLVLNIILFWIFLADPPDIQVEKSWIHSGEGFEAKLVCIVYADPVATVSYEHYCVLLFHYDFLSYLKLFKIHFLNITHTQ